MICTIPFQLFKAISKTNKLPRNRASTHSKLFKFLVGAVQFKAARMSGVDRLMFSKKLYYNNSKQGYSFIRIRRQLKAPFNIVFSVILSPSDC